MALGALLATVGYVAWHVHAHGPVGGVYVGAVSGVVLFFVGLAMVVRGR